MIQSSKRDIFKNLQKTVLQIESLEAQIDNTFDVEKKLKFKAQLKARWILIDKLLDEHNEGKLSNADI